MKKRNRLTICLVAGVLILAVSATAAFGSVNGYSRYKEALKALALKTENFTVNGTMSMTYDGKEVTKIVGDYAMDGANHATHSKVWSEGEEQERYETYLNGVRTSFNVNDRYYYQNEYVAGNSFNLLGIDNDDEMMNRLVNFTEIATDTVMGELKNNFVQMGKENGATLYQVEIAKNQVPSLVNAGLSLFAYSVGTSNRMDGAVIYENYGASVLTYYEKTTGETLSQEFKDGYINGGSSEWYKANQELINKVDNVNSENWEETYYKVLSDKGNTGIVYVKSDGSYTYYTDYEAYVAAHPNEGTRDFDDYVGQDMSLETVLCKFGVDDTGKLMSNNLQVTFQTTDKKGENHTLVITVDAAFSAYGSTAIQPLDVGGREKYE